MKTARRSFIKTAGAAIGGLLTAAGVKAKESKRKIVLPEDKELTFIVDIPGKEVRVKGFFGRDKRRNLYIDDI
jgi:hypothetical protein